MDDQVSLPQIVTGSHVTLHYRIAVKDGDTERDVVNTFGTRPATLQIGMGQLAEPLEAQLIGLEEGAEANFDIPAGAGYGHRSAELVQTISRATFDANADRDVHYVAGDVVEFNSPAGQRFTGVLKHHDERRMVVDFNHPLAGMPLRFSVHVIGVL